MSIDIVTRLRRVADQRWETTKPDVPVSVPEARIRIGNRRFERFPLVVEFGYRTDGTRMYYLNDLIGCSEAADEIERLRARVAELEAERAPAP